MDIRDGWANGMFKLNNSYIATLIQLYALISLDDSASDSSMESSLGFNSYVYRIDLDSGRFSLGHRMREVEKRTWLLKGNLAFSHWLP